MAKVEEKIEELLAKTITDLGYDLYDVEYVKEGKDMFLRIFIDKENGIDLEDCEKVNNAISDLLDEANYIKEQYFLEVSSPGIERTLRKNIHFQKNIEKEISIKLFKPLNGKKEIVGILKGFNDENIIIFYENEELEINKKDISLVKTVFHW